MQRLQPHANIVSGVEYIPELLRGRGYLIMEKVSGEHVLNFVMREGPIKEERAKEIVRGVAAGIVHMHERGVVHRDMNPTNVFVEANDLGYVKIMDFNVSKLCDVPESQDYKTPLYHMFTKTGTPLYTAPEMQLTLKYK